MTTKYRQNIYGASIRASSQRAKEARKQRIASPARRGTCECLIRRTPKAILPKNKGGRRRNVFQTATLLIR
jgi:hypothetical protein